MISQERKLVTALPGPASVALAARRKAAVAGAVAVGNEVYIERGEGAILLDVDGNQHIDFGCGDRGRVGRSRGTSRGGGGGRAGGPASSTPASWSRPTRATWRCASSSNRLTPGVHAKRTALFNSGAEAVENAVKVARVHTGRQAVIAFDHAYHGRTNLTMALTAKVQPYKDGFGPFAPEVYRMGMAYPYRWPGGADRCAAEAFDQFASTVHLQVGETHVAAVIVEPIQGEGGFIVPAPGFLRMLADWCAEHGVVFIADEVQTGFCRTGDWFASEAEGVVPDVVTTAKALGGGLPLAAVTGRAEIMDAPVLGGLGGTFGGNPVSCAAALAAISMMEAQDLRAKARAIGDALTARLGALAQRYPQIGEVRGRGAMMAIELVAPDGSKRPDPALAKALVAGCARRGVVILACGSFGNVVRMLPPLVIEPSLVEDAMDVLAEAFAEVVG